MSTKNATSIPPPYNGKNDETSSTTIYHQQIQSSKSGIQEPRPIPIGSSVTVVSSNQSMTCRCPNCHQLIVTRVEKSNGLIVWLVAAGICLLGFVLGCCLIPFFIDGIKDTTHYCPNCNTVIARNKKI